jgi:hypothetical protein
LKRIPFDGVQHRRRPVGRELFAELHAQPAHHGDGRRVVAVGDADDPRHDVDRKTPRKDGLCGFRRIAAPPRLPAERPIGFDAIPFPYVSRAAVAEDLVRRTLDDGVVSIAHRRIVFDQSWK